MYSGVPAFQCSGVPAFRCSGIPVFLLLLHATVSTSERLLLLGRQYAMLTVMGDFTLGVEITSGE